METTSSFGVRTELLAFRINLPRVLQIRLQTLCIVVGIDKIIAGVVRRIDVDEFDFAVVALLQELENFQVVALDHEVAGRLPVDTLVWRWAKCPGGRSQSGLSRGTLARPAEAKSFVLTFHRFSQELPQNVEVDRAFNEGPGNNAASCSMFS